MRLPFDLLAKTYVKPRLFLCETDKTRICQLENTKLEGSFKFNSTSEISFEVAYIYNDLLTGEQRINPFYDKIDVLRLVELENFGYFEIQSAEITGDGIKESKTISAKSSEYTMSQKYLEDFYINTGEINSVEVIYGGVTGAIVPVRLYWPEKKELSLLHLILEKVPGWSIGHVDNSLQTLSRQFEVDRQSVYDFLTNEICAKFHCYIVFDTIKNEINLYAESLNAKFVGDGVENQFQITPVFSKVSSVTVGGYQTTKWEYDFSTGILTLNEPPAAGLQIEVIDGGLEQWTTDVFITFDNLSQEVNVSYNADDIKTVLNVTYGEDNDIREVNLGLPYLTDLSYYYTVDWMGQDLYDAYTNYLIKSNSARITYTQNAKKMTEIYNYIDFEMNRLSLEYSIVQGVSETTVGTYYVRGGTAPNYYYTEVSLPQDWNANTTYYSTKTTNLNERKVHNLYEALKAYFDMDEDWVAEFEKLQDDFLFMDEYTLSELITDLRNAQTENAKDYSVHTFLNKMWNEIGKVPLKSLYYETYKKVQMTNIEAGWSKKGDDNYWRYYPVILYLESIENAIKDREAIIDRYQAEYDIYAEKNQQIAGDLSMSANFTDMQIIRLSPFLREDEVNYEDIVETDLDSLEDSFKLKESAMENGRIELSKLCQPQLSFAMDMANIYALPEFEPIVNQFQLGNVIKVGIRDGYVKQSRLLEVNINFDNFSDFSCEFGELTNLRSQSDIHADLLKQTIQAGKSVASNAHSWSQGADMANSIDKRLEEGLLNSIEALKANDGTQDATLDRYGLHLQKVDPVTGDVDPRQVWMLNNQIVFTDDGFKTTKAVLGEFNIGNETNYGLLADAVIAGYIEGSQMKGGTIQIGENGDGSYAFEVHADGTVTMGGGSTIAGYVTKDDFDKTKEEFENSKTTIGVDPPQSPYVGQLWVHTSDDGTILKTWNGTEWIISSAQPLGTTLYTSKPDNYSAGDLWILADGETCGKFTAGSILKAEVDSSVFNESHWVDAIESTTKILNNFTFSPETGLRIGQTDNKFYANIDSTEMGFYDNSNDDDPNKKVVSIGNQNATIKNVIVEDKAELNCDVKINGNIIIPGFAIIQENNGSISIVTKS